MPSKEKAPPEKNTEPSPMTHEVRVFPSLAQQRMRLAAEAESMSATELRTAAADAQIDTSGAKSKEQLVAAVQQGARGTDAAATSTTIPNRG